MQTMQPTRRVFFDISYTRTQLGNVGITRTVRQLLTQLELLVPQQVACVMPVAFHSGGFRRATAVRPELAAGPGALSGRGARNASQLFRFLHGSVARRLAKAVLPHALLRRTWEFHSSWTFDQLSAGEEPVAFHPGDVLLLCDESWNYHTWQGSDAAARQGAAVILMCYDLIPIRYPAFCTRLFSDVFKRWLLEMITRVDGVICISRATRDELAEFCVQQGLVAPPLAHFRLGCDLPPSVSGSPPRDRIRDFLADSAPCFAAIGTIEPRKNHAFLLSVFERLWARGVQVKLMIAGRPHPECHSLIASMNSHPEQGRRLLTVADASDAEVGAAYVACRALLLPTLAEGFGLPLVEARARGCPVIASDLPALAELKDAGVFLYPPNSADALEALIIEHATSNLRDRFKPMPPFTWSDSAQQCVDALSHLLGARTAERNVSAAPNAVAW